MTMDVDLVLALDPQNVDRFVAAARELALHPVAPEPVTSLASLADPVRLRTLIEEEHLIAFAMSTPEPAAPTVDILIGADLDFDAAFARRLTRELDGTPISLRQWAI